MLEPELIDYRLEDTVLRNKDNNDAAQVSVISNTMPCNGREARSSFFKMSFVWVWKFIRRTSRCYIIFQVLYYCVTKLKPDPAV